MPPKKKTESPKTVALKGSLEKNAFYVWLWMSGTHMRNAASKPLRVDAALYRKFKRASNDTRSRDAFLGSVND
jgi:hypothetical protein